MSQGNDYSKGFVIGALVGGVAGALTALLLAPKAGIELRQDIATTSKDVYGKASQFVVDTEKKVEEAVKKGYVTGTAKAKDLINTAKNAGNIDIAFDEDTEEA